MAAFLRLKNLTKSAAGKRFASTRYGGSVENPGKWDWKLYNFLVGFPCVSMVVYKKFILGDEEHPLTTWWREKQFEQVRHSQRKQVEFMNQCQQYTYEHIEKKKRPYFPPQVAYREVFGYPPIDTTRKDLNLPSLDD